MNYPVIREYLSQYKELNYTLVDMEVWDTEYEDTELEVETELEELLKEDILYIHNNPVSKTQVQLELQDKETLIIYQQEYFMDDEGIEGVGENLEQEFSLTTRISKVLQRN